MPSGRLSEVLRLAVAGAFPEPDGAIEVVPPYRAGVEAVVSLTGHAVIASTMTAKHLAAVGADGCGGATLPPVLSLLAGPGGAVDVLTVMLGAPGTGRTDLPERVDLLGRPRSAADERDHVHVHGDERGMVSVGRGVGGLAQVAVEVFGPFRGRGAGGRLMAAGRGLVPAGEPVLACVPPDNVPALRAALAAGFRPLGSLQLVRPATGRRTPGRLPAHPLFP